MFFVCNFSCIQQPQTETDHLYLFSSFLMADCNNYSANIKKNKLTSDNTNPVLTQNQCKHHTTNLFAQRACFSEHRLLQLCSFSPHQFIFLFIFVLTLHRYFRNVGFINNLLTRAPAVAVLACHFITSSAHHLAGLAQV